MAKYQPIRIAHRLFEAVKGSDKRLAPVIFLHDVFDCKEVWFNIPKLVAEKTKRKVFTYDARNHGESEFTKDSDFRHNLQDLYAFMDQMEIKDSILVGHSFGGVTAISAALKEPSNVEKAFILDMSVNIPSSVIEKKMSEFAVWPEKFEKLAKITRFPERFMELLFDGMAPKVLGKSIEDQEYYKIMKEYITTQQCKKFPDGSYRLNFNHKVLMDALDMYKKDPIVHTGNYTGPAYFIYGTLSLFRQYDVVSEIEKLFPAAKFAEYEAATGIFFTDKPQNFVDLIVENM